WRSLIRNLSLSAFIERFGRAKPNQQDRGRATPEHDSPSQRGYSQESSIPKNHVNQVHSLGRIEKVKDHTWASKNEFQCKLHGPGAAHLVNGTQGTEALVEGRCGLSECRRAEEWTDESKVRVVKDVERLCTELELQLVVQWEVSTYS